MRQFSDDQQGFIPAEAQLKYKNINKQNNTLSIRRQHLNKPYKVHYRFSDGFIKKQPQLVFNTPLAMPSNTYTIKPNNSQSKANTNIKHPYIQYCVGKNYTMKYCKQNTDFPILNEQQYIKNQVFLSSVQDKNSPSNKELKSFELQDIKYEDDDLLFDSKFENGNLHCAFRKNGTNQYHLFISNDTNTYGYNQWYYFSIRNMKPQQTYTFLIVNYRKMINFYKHQQKISIFSMKKAQKQGVGWYHGGKNISFQSSTMRADFNKKMYVLKFELDIKFNEDFIMIASNLPYSYSRLIRDLDALKVQADGSSFVNLQINSICTTVCNNQVPQITLSSKENEGEGKKGKINDCGERKTKKMLIFMARQHPGEVWSSYMMLGVMRSLLKQSEQSKYLLSNYIIKIYPMVNIDGVIHGNFRCDITGVDLNRRWKQPSKIFHPQIYQIKRRIQNYSKKFKIQVCFDLHGHSKNYNIFCYSCKHNPYTCRILPYIISKQNKLFYMPSCTFGLTKDKLSTARATISKIIKSQNVLTIQISGHGQKDNLQLKQFNPLDIFKFSQHLIASVRCFLDKKNSKYLQYQAYVHKNIGQFFKFDTANEEQYGSDSEPQEDEIEFKIKLNSVIDKCYQAQYRSFLHQSDKQLHLNDIRFVKGISEQQTIQENVQMKDQSIQLGYYSKSKRYNLYHSEILNKEIKKTSKIKQQAPKKIRQVLHFKKTFLNNQQKQKQMKYKSINRSQLSSPQGKQSLISQRGNNYKSLRKNIVIRDVKKHSSLINSKYDKDLDNGIGTGLDVIKIQNTKNLDTNKSIQDFIHKYERYIPNTISYRFKSKEENNQNQLNLLQEGLAKDDPHLQLNLMLQNKRLLQLQKLKSMIESSTLIAQRQGKIKFNKKEAIVDYRKFKTKQKFDKIMRISNDDSQKII